MFSAPLQVYIECFYHLLSLLPKAVLLIPSRVRVYTAFGGVSFFVVFVFCFVENKYLWGHLGSIGVWAQFIFHGFLWSLSARFGGWGEGRSQALIDGVWNSIFMSVATAFVHFEPTFAQANQSSSFCLQLLPRLAENPSGLGEHGVVVPRSTRVGSA